MGFLTSHHCAGKPHLGMDSEHVTILRLDTLFKDAIPSLMGGANRYVHVWSLYHLRRPSQTPKSQDVQPTKYCFSVCGGILIGEGGEKTIPIYKNPCKKTHLSSKFLAGPFCLRKHLFNFDIYFPPPLWKLSLSLRQDPHLCGGHVHSNYPTTSRHSTWFNSHSTRCITS